MPAPKHSDDWDTSHIPYLSVSLEEVKANFDAFGLLDDQVSFLKGWFGDTLPTAPIQELAVLRLDGDLYHSTMDALQNLYHKVSKGGYVIVDDYHSWPGCKQAVTDFLNENSLSPDIQNVDRDAVCWKREGTGGCPVSYSPALTASIPFTAASTTSAGMMGSGAM